MRRKHGRRDEQESYDLADVNEQEQAKDGYEERESAFEQEQEKDAYGDRESAFEQEQKKDAYGERESAVEQGQEKDAYGDRESAFEQEQEKDAYGEHESAFEQGQEKDDYEKRETAFEQEQEKDAYGERKSAFDQEQEKNAYGERESAFEQERTASDSQSAQQTEKVGARPQSNLAEDPPPKTAQLERAEPRALPPAEEQVFSKFEETDKRVSGTKKEKKRKRGTSGAPYVALIVLCFLGAVALIGYMFYAEYAQRADALPPVEDQSPDDSADQSTPLPLPDVSDAQTVYQVGAKSSVGVAVTRDGKTQYASGTVVFDGGFVATLYEVVADAGRIEIISADGARYPAELIGTEPRVNLALLSCPASLSAVSAVSDGAPAAGSSVFAIGNLEGDGYGASLVRTYVAYSDRQARIEDGDGKEWVWSVIQLGRLADESLAGCPVFDPSGHAVGIALSCPPQGEVSLAIPIERALAVLRCIRDGTPAPEALLAAIAHAPPTLGILGEQRQTDSLVGICVVGFTSSDCDAAKKLRAGDIIYKIGDTPTPDAATLKGAVECKKPSESVEVFISRGNQKLSFWVQLQ